MIVRWPGAAPEPDASTGESMQRLVGSLEDLDGDALEPPPDQGSARYYVAACRRVGEKDVALVADIPMAVGGKPNPEVLARARRIVKSLAVAGDR